MLSTTLSRQTTADHEDRAARTELMQLKSNPPHRMDGDHAQRVYKEQLKELQAEADRCADELAAAKAEADRLRRVCVRQQLEGPRLDAHREITGNILDALRTLQDAIDADQKFRAQLLKDMLPFRPPLESIRPYDAGGERWADELLPVVEGWISKVQKRDAYNLVERPVPAKPNHAVPQLV